MLWLFSSVISIEGEVLCWSWRPAVADQGGGPVFKKGDQRKRIQAAENMGYLRKNHSSSCPQFSATKQVSFSCWNAILYWFPCLFSLNVPIYLCVSKYIYILSPHLFLYLFSASLCKWGDCHSKCVMAPASCLLVDRCRIAWIDYTCFAPVAGSRNGKLRMSSLN